MGEPITTVTGTGAGTGTGSVVLFAPPVPSYLPFDPTYSTLLSFENMKPRTLAKGTTTYKFCEAPKDLTGTHTHHADD